MSRSDVETARAADRTIVGDHPETKGLVSAIIIFLDEEKFLAEAIDSVLAQSVPHWELLLIDDGSTDRSEAIARDYVARYPDKIRYLTHDGRANRGMSATRNLGLRAARGEFIAFLDGDDCWFPDKLEQQLALFARFPHANTVCGATVRWHSWNPAARAPDRTVFTGELLRHDGRSVVALEPDRLYGPGELMTRLYPLGRGVTPSSSGAMMRRDVTLELGGYDESFRGLFEDQVFRAKTYLAGPIYVASTIYDRYRQHEQSCCHVARATNQSDDPRHRFLLWLQSYLDEIGSTDDAVRSRLKRALMRHDHPWLYRIWSPIMTTMHRIGLRP